MRDNLQKLGTALLLAFVLMGMAQGYWALIRKETLINREDNPRRVLEAQQIVRGDILDRSGEILATSRIDSETGVTERVYLLSGVAPAVGYASFRYGEVGVEAAYSDHLSGVAFLTPSQHFWNSLLHRPPVGGDVRLTLDRDLQIIAENKLMGQAGGIVLINARSGAILALASSPTFDPNILDETWDALVSNPNAPLINRVTQGLYQPGTLMHTVVVTAALQTSADSAFITLLTEGGRSVLIEGDRRLACLSIPSAPVMTLDSAFIWGCPGPFLELAEDLGSRSLDESIHRLALTEPPQADIAAESVEAGDNPAPDNLRLTALGQGDLTVTPLHMVRLAAAVANEGLMPALQLGEGVRPSDDDAWQSIPRINGDREALTPEEAGFLKELFSLMIREGAIAPLVSGTPDLYGQAGQSLTGQADNTASWFIGFVYLPDGTPLAVSVVIEDAPALSASRIGITMLETAYSDYR